jgi:hypothetical protein
MVIFCPLLKWAKSGKSGFLTRNCEKLKNRDEKSCPLAHFCFESGHKKWAEKVNIFYTKTAFLG